VRGDGSDELSFLFEVPRGGIDGQGIALDSPAAIDLAGGSITDAATDRAAELSLSQPGSFQEVRIDGVAPRVKSVEPPRGTADRTTGNRLTFSLAFDEPVEVEGEPQLVFKAGDAVRRAAFTGMADPGSLEFAYTVAAGDASEAGVTATALALSGGSIRDRAGNPAETEFAAVRSPKFAINLRPEPTLPLLVPAPPAGQKPQLDQPPDSDGQTGNEDFSVMTNSIGMKLVRIPRGEFRMGSAESRDEGPVHNVRITRPFLLGQTEVSIGQFLTFYNNAYKGKLDCEKDGKGGWGWKGPAEALARSRNYPNAKFDIWYQSSRFTPWSWGHRDIDFTSDSAKQRSFLYPVVNVSWNDCNAFCEWLSGKEGKNYRLPTEAEWEYACRARTNTRFWTGDDPESLAYKENVADRTAKTYVGESITLSWKYIKAEDGQALTAPVGSFRSNGFGLYDMAGNVSEWCGDWYGADYGERIAGKSAVDPRGPPTGSFRVIRGGGWDNNPVNCRSASRLSGRATDRGASLGFRVVCELE
jgi:sulfatase modifying factor 1